jgi:hypothetical protein
MAMFGRHSESRCGIAHKVELNQNRRLFAFDPAVVAGLDDDGGGRGELLHASIRELHVNPPSHQESHVRVRAPVSAGNRLLSLDQRKPAGYVTRFTRPPPAATMSIVTPPTSRRSAPGTGAVKASKGMAFSNSPIHLFSNSPIHQLRELHSCHSCSFMVIHVIS